MASSNEFPWEYSLRKYLLLLATVAATVTYTAGFTPPGGVWQEKDSAGGYLAGDPIIRHTSYTRYVAFFYLNAAAFASSLVVIMLTLILSVRHELTTFGNGMKWLSPLVVLRGFMVLDLLSLTGAYTAGIYRDRDVPVYTMILAVLTIVYLVVFHMVLPRQEQKPVPVDDQQQKKADADERKKREKLSKVLMLLATFAVSVTYSAGLNAPGGFWEDAEDGHHPGEPILMGGHHETRLKAFVHLNSTAFFFSLLIAVQLLDKNLRTVDSGKVLSRFRLLCISIVFALLGLVGAYAAGSSRATATTIYVTLVGAAIVAAYIIILLGLSHFSYPRPEEKEGKEKEKEDKEKEKEENEKKEARSLVLLLATLVTTITYQAGLDPPGGLWENDGEDYKAGDPVLQTTHRSRYNAFFYCNSVAFVASLVATSS